MKTLAIPALLALLCAPLAAQRIDNVPVPATVEQLPPATLDELARTAVATPLGGHQEKARPRLAAPRAAGDNAVVADFVKVTDASAAAPPAPRGFRAAFDPFPAAQFVYDPADASGAVGPRHVVGAFNNSLSVHDKSGKPLSFLSIYQFWHDDRYPDTTVYDPRLIYDAVYDRFVLAMLTDSNGSNGVLLFAVSATGDPTGTWQRFRIGGGFSSTVIIDFTRMALTADRIVITASEYIGEAPTGAVNVFLIPRNGPFADSPSLSTLVHLSPAFDLTPVSAPDATLRFLAQNNDTIQQYVLTLSPAASISKTNTYLPPAGFLGGDGECGQLGTSTLIECDGSLLHYAFIRNGVLWIVHSANDDTRGFIVIWKITGGSGTAKGYVIGDPAANYGYPSIAVNKLGGVLVGYSTFSDTTYPSAGYRYIDPDGNVSAPAVVKSGEDWYGGVRWGDYSTTVVDPSDDTNFWTLQSYATPAINVKHLTWGTWWTYVQVKAPQRVRAVRH